MEKIQLKESQEKITNPLEIKQDIETAFAGIQDLVDKDINLILPEGAEIAGTDLSGKSIMSVLDLFKKELSVFEQINENEQTEDVLEKSEIDTSDWLKPYVDLIRNPKETKKTFWSIKGTQKGGEVVVEYRRRNEKLAPGKEVPDQNISLDVTENILTINEWKVAENIFKKYEKLEDEIENGTPEIKSKARTQMLDILKEEKFRRKMMRFDEDRLNLDEIEGDVIKSTETQLQKEIKDYVEKYRFLGMIPEDFNLIQFQTKIINILSQAVLLNLLPVDSKRIPKVKPEIKEIPSFKINLENLAHAFKEQDEENKGFALLLGEAGTGKNEAVEYFAAKTNRPLYVMSAGRGMDSHDLMVSDDFNPLEGKITHYTELTEGIQTPGAVVMIDEVNSLLPAVQAILHGLADGRRSVTYNGFNFKVADDVLIVIAGNPAVYSAANDLGQALVSRTRGQSIRMNYPALRRSDMEERLNSWSSLDKLKAELEDNSIRTEYMADEVLATYTKIPELKNLNEKQFKLLWNYYVNEASDLDIKIKEDKILAELNEKPEIRKTIIDLRDILEVADEWRKNYLSSKGNFNLYGIGLRDTIAVTKKYVETRDVRKAWLDTYADFMDQPIEGTDELYRELVQLLNLKLQ